MLKKIPAKNLAMEFLYRYGELMGWTMSINVARKRLRDEAAKDKKLQRHVKAMKMAFVKNKDLTSYHQSIIGLLRQKPRGNL